MRPSPEMTMPEAAVVSLHAEAERIAAKNLLVEMNFSGETRVGVRRPRKSDPTFVAQRDPKFGAVMQIPGNPVPAGMQRATPTSFFDSMGTSLQKKWFFPRGHLQGCGGILFNPCFRPPSAREPRCPDLYRGRTRKTGAAFASQVRQKEAQPPRPRTIAQAETQKPRFIPAAHAEPAKRQIQRSHVSSLELFGRE